MLDELPHTTYLFMLAINQANIKPHDTGLIEMSCEWKCENAYLIEDKRRMPASLVVD